MELFFLKLFVFLRPIMFVETPFSVFGLNLFELAAILFSFVLLGTLVVRAAVRKDVVVSGIDLLMLGFSVWCLTVFAVYPHFSDVRDLAKYSLPFLTYVAARTTLSDSREYRAMLWLMLVGFSVPVAASAGLIAAGLGVDRLNFWTGIPRYLGVYSGPHNMAHNMTFLMMTVVLYLFVGRTGKDDLAIGRWRATFLAVLIALALYCLYASAVRTAIVGLLVFGGALLFIYRFRIFLLACAVLIVVAAALSQTLQRQLLYESVMAQRIHDNDVADFASGRPRIWENAWKDFSALPLDRKIAGAGIGNSAEKPWSDLRYTADAHNDFLEVLLETGVVGFVLFMLLQLFVLRAILTLRGLDRHLFLALFLAVVAMNFGSNSYVARFGLAQMYYFVLAYVEVARRSALRRSLSSLDDLTTVRRIPAALLGRQAHDV